MLSASRNRPNIVMLMLDTLRADRLGCYGYRRRTVSPAIDEVARGSILFERAIASAPWTLPSHASLFTGLHPSQHGADDVSLYLHERHRTLAERLSGAGYRTAAFCAHNAWFSAAAGLARGFQLCVGPELKEDASGLREMAARTADQEQYLSAEGCEVLGFARYCLHRLADRHAPLFLFLHSMINHQPYRPADASWDKLGADPVPADLTAHLAENFRELRANPETITAEQAEAMDLLYDACVATADELAARLIELIGRRLGWERTVLVITSDHRQNLGEHGMWGHWLCLADTLLHVPLLIYPRPFASLPARVSAPVQQADLCSTLLRLSGAAGQ
ncbi:MAG: sulfatase, partial [Candidatus Brocadiia bacterium]